MLPKKILQLSKMHHTKWKYSSIRPIPRPNNGLTSPVARIGPANTGATARTGWSAPPGEARQGVWGPSTASHENVGRGLSSLQHCTESSGTLTLRGVIHESFETRTMG